MNKFKKILAMSLLLAGMVSTTANAETVQLYENETSKDSAAVGTFYTAELNGSNSSNSKYSVYWTLYYSIPGKSWSQRAEYLVGIGSDLGYKAVRTEQKVNYYLELNPKGLGTKGCRATGNVY